MEKFRKLLLSNDMDSGDFRCSLCFKFLSVKPIFYCSSIGNICGRCQVPNSVNNINKSYVPTLEKQTVFENVIQHLDFPCSYYKRGCKKSEMNSEDVVDHEALCEFRYSSCPFAFKEYLEEEQSECIWKGSDSELSEHLRTEHKQCFLDPPQICLAPEFRSKLICVQSSNGLVFLILLDYQKKSYKYNLQIYADAPIEQCKQYHCDIDILDSNKRYSIQTEKCKSLFIGFTSDHGEEGLEIDIYSIKELFKKPTVTMSFNIKTKENNITSSPVIIENSTSSQQSSEMEIDELDDEFKEKITCDSCKKFLISPIFSCSSGHNSCHKCYQGNSGACICAKRDLVENNFTLDLISRGLNYSCKNDGCSYRGPILKLTEHHEVCIFAIRKCLFDCSWTGNYNSLFQHVQEKHGFLNVNEISNLPLDSEYYQMITFDEKLFF